MYDTWRKYNFTFILKLTSYPGGKFRPNHFLCIIYHILNGYEVASQEMSPMYMYNTSGNVKHKTKPLVNFVYFEDKNSSSS